MRKIFQLTLAVAAGAAAAATAGVVVASAATPTPSPAATRSAHRHLLHLPRLVGEVVSDSATTLVVKAPDGTTVTLSLTTRTRAWKYQGPGEKPVSESPATIPAGELVAVYGGRFKTEQPIARLVVDLGFQAAS
jgi:hypothetical protein